MDPVHPVIITDVAHHGEVIGSEHRGKAASGASATDTTG
jgi:hypothetical protein